VLPFSTQLDFKPGLGEPDLAGLALYEHQGRPGRATPVLAFSGTPAKKLGLHVSCTHNDTTDGSPTPLVKDLFHEALLKPSLFKRQRNLHQPTIVSVTCSL
jgi:hypothetical protein